MNQILEILLIDKKHDVNKFKKKLVFQFYFSLFLIIVIISFIIYKKLKLHKQELYSKEILNNYNITKLYSNDNINLRNTEDNFNIIGIIEISKLNIYYPIFSKYDENILKISPCRFYGPEPGKVGNLCIAGHNYDNDKFFSKISSLHIDDEIIIYNNLNKKFSYYVYDIYEVIPNDFSPIYSYNSDSVELTLITCNNLNNNRIIIKAKLCY